MTTAQRAQQAIDAYLDEARRVNGDEYADATRLSYHRGWFKLTSPSRYGGRYLKSSGQRAKALRRYELEQATDVLRARPDHEGQ